MAALKPMNDEFKNKFKTEIMKIISTKSPPRIQTSLPKPTLSLSSSKSLSSIKTHSHEYEQPTSPDTKPSKRARSSKNLKPRHSSSSESSEDDMRPNKMIKSTSADESSHKKLSYTNIIYKYQIHSHHILVYIYTNIIDHSHYQQARKQSSNVNPYHNHPKHPNQRANGIQKAH